MTELHLDLDEWNGILHSLKCEIKLCKEQSKQDLYVKWLENIVLKIECAVELPSELQESAELE